MKTAKQAAVKLQLEQEYGRQIRHYEGLPSRIEQLERDIESKDSEVRDLRNRNNALSEEMQLQLAANRLILRERDTHQRNHENAETRHGYTKETLSRLQKRLEGYEDARKEQIGTIARLNDIIAGLQSTVLEQNGEIQRLKAHIGTIEGQQQLERARIANESAGE